MPRQQGKSCHIHTRFRRTPRRPADIVALLTDDVLGQTRESSSLDPYMVALTEIDADPAHFLLIVREGRDDRDGGPAVATMQLTIVPGMSRGGAKRLQIEAVRVAAGTRGTGLGSALFDWAHDYGRTRGATLAQLTSDVTRTDAHRFNGRLGYTASHQGFKLIL
ncbi:GNAT family N-acetyltransferase [Corynebacterium sp. USCH3]|uniref:GNAT family N-acetyltransferase n=1 Tax=Corynebacterium sp. USCH3 TaxID=3024840 RepID=UPI0030B3561F